VVGAHQLFAIGQLEAQFEDDFFVPRIADLDEARFLLAPERRLLCALHPNRPTPTIGIQRRPAPKRVFEDVGPFLIVFGVIADHAIEILILPDAADMLAVPTDMLRGERFP